jgi:hypothetical protein
MLGHLNLVARVHFVSCHFNNTENFRVFHVSKHKLLKYGIYAHWLYFQSQTFYPTEAMRTQKMCMYCIEHFCCNITFENKKAKLAIG